MATPVDPRLAALPDPYDFKARKGIRYPWDSSYFNGRFYLYFSPLPVLIFYLPYHLLLNSDPSDALVGIFFSAWAFLAMVAFTRRALMRSDRPSLIPFPVWLYLIGFGNVVVFVLPHVTTYLVAIMTGMAMTAMWALALQRFVESPTIQRVIWMSIWLALSIAARPNLGVLLFVSIAVIVIELRGGFLTREIVLAFFIPLAVIATALFWYNFARFRDPFEFGTRYQLTITPMEGRSVCGVHNLPEAMRFANQVMHYVLWPPTIRSTFPFVDLSYAQLDLAVSFPSERGGTDKVVGIASLVPLTLLGFFIAILSLTRFGRGSIEASTRAAIYVTAGASLILLGLSTCWWVTARYSLDFMMLFVGASAICIEEGLSALRALGMRMLPLRLCVAALACYSIAIGFLLGYVQLVQPT